MTHQVGEQLVIDGHQLHMVAWPELPASHPLIEELPRERWSRYTLGHRGGNVIRSSACWRNYVGTWAVRDQRLWLVDLRGRFRLNTSEPVFAEWVSAVLRAPRGEVVHRSLRAVVSAEELRVEVARGIVVRTEVLDRRGITHDQLERIARGDPS